MTDLELERIPVSSPASVTVFERILTHGPLGRADVARATGLSQAAVTKAVASLLAAGYVAERDDVRPDVTIGRPISPLVVVPDRAAMVGIKLTSSAAYGVLVNLAADTLASAQRPLISNGVEHVLEMIADLLHELRDRAPGGKVDGLGVSVSGDVDPRTGRVRHSALMGWEELDLGNLLEERIGLPVVVENDVRALTFAERLFGLGADAASFAVITIGTGIGCGIFVNGEVVQGAHGISGEIGHLPLAPPDQKCSCGQYGCVEAIASTEAIVARVRAAEHDDNLRMADAIALARAGNDGARAAFAQAGETIGAALAILVNLIDPELVIIAGEGVSEYDLYEQQIRSTYLKHVFGSAVGAVIQLQPHTFDDWARGAAVGVIREIARGQLR